MNITNFLATLIVSMSVLSSATFVYAVEGHTGDAIYVSGGIGQEESS